MKYAKQNAPVKTGLLKNSIYAITFNSKGTVSILDKSTGERRTLSKPISSSRRRVAKRQLALIFPELSVSLDDKTAYAAVGAIYGIFVELGMHARPFWYEAIDKARAEFEEELGTIEEALGQDIEGSIEDESE